MDTRCCCPPERRAGYSCSRPDKPDKIQVQPSDLFGLRTRDLLDRDRRLDHVLERGEMREEVEVLEDQADPHSDAVNELVLLGGRQPSRRGPADFHIADSNVPLVEAFEPVQAPQHRGLAAARRPENRGELALGDAERGAIQHRRRAVALDDVGDVDHEGSSTGSKRIALRGDHIRSRGCQRLSEPRIELSRPAGRRCPRRSRRFESSVRP